MFLRKGKSSPEEILDPLLADAKLVEAIITSSLSADLEGKLSSAHPHALGNDYGTTVAKEAPKRIGDALATFGYKRMDIRGLRLYLSPDGQQVVFIRQARRIDHTGIHSNRISKTLLFAIDQGNKFWSLQMEWQKPVIPSIETPIGEVFGDVRPYVIGILLVTDKSGNLAVYLAAPYPNHDDGRNYHFRCRQKHRLYPASGGPTLRSSATPPGPTPSPIIDLPDADGPDGKGGGS